MPVSLSGWAPGSLVSLAAPAAWAPLARWDARVSMGHWLEMKSFPWHQGIRRLLMWVPYMVMAGHAANNMIQFFKWSCLLATQLMLHEKGEVRCHQAIWKWSCNPVLLIFKEQPFILGDSGLLCHVPRLPLMLLLTWSFTLPCISLSQRQWAGNEMGITRWEALPLYLSQMDPHLPTATADPALSALEASKYPSNSFFLKTKNKTENSILVVLGQQAFNPSSGRVCVKGWPLTGRLSASVPCEGIVSWKQQWTAQPPTNAIRGANFLASFPPFFSHQSWALQRPSSLEAAPSPKHTEWLWLGWPSHIRRDKDEDGLATKQLWMDSSKIQQWIFKPSLSIDCTFLQAKSEPLVPELMVPLPS